MEIRVLRYFIEVARTGSLTRAADVLHITQPSLSKQIKLLENELGQKLFRRGHYKMILTEVGRSFLARAEAIVDLSDLTLSEYTSENKDIQGELSICFIDRTFSERVAALISDFQQLYPKIKLKLFCGCLEYVNALFAKKKVDIIFTFYGAEPTEHTKVCVNHSRRLGFVMRNDCELAKHHQIQKSQYDGLPLIIPRGNLCDEFGQSLKIEFDDRYVAAEVQEPLDFLFLAKSSGAYLYCIEPPEELLQYSGLVFRPISPGKTASLYFVQQDVEEPTQAMQAFMDHAAKRVDSRSF